MSDSKPKLYAYDDFIDELMRVADDAQNCVYRLGQDRSNRIDVIDRLVILMDIGKDKIIPAFRDAMKKLDGGRH
ncbi:MAG TPA: hypothetical protein VIF40_18040 [Methylosinus sp.]|jgi:hypothetical protein|uniref:hypothetical protein n=1 Tax=Methylosinus sp. TaxID=427 RepID=UPI002F929022